MIAKYVIWFLPQASGINMHLSNSVYFDSHLMPILSLEDHFSTAPSPFSYPFSLAAILALAGIALIPFSYPFSLAAILASAGIAPIPLMYPLLPRYECKCKIVNSFILLGFASNWKIAYWNISSLYFVKQLITCMCRGEPYHAIMSSLVFTLSFTFMVLRLR